MRNESEPRGGEGLVFLRAQRDANNVRSVRFKDDRGLTAIKNQPVFLGENWN